MNSSVARVLQSGRPRTALFLRHAENMTNEPSTFPHHIAILLFGGRMCLR